MAARASLTTVAPPAVATGPELGLELGPDRLEAPALGIAGGGAAAGSCAAVVSTSRAVACSPCSASRGARLRKVVHGWVQLPGLPPPLDQVAVAAEGGVGIAATLPQGDEGDVREAAGEPGDRRGVDLDAPTEEPLGLLVVDAHQQLAERVAGRRPR